MSEVLLGHGDVGGRSLDGVGRLRGHRLVRHRQHADRADRARRGTAISGSREYAGVAFIVGRSGGVQPDDWLGVERELRQLHENAKILFLDAPDDVLIHRFEGNRRRHPFEAATLAESIKGERALLQSIRDGADLVIDTGSINANQLRSRNRRDLHGDGGARLLARVARLLRLLQRPAARRRSRL